MSQVRAQKRCGNQTGIVVLMYTGIGNTKFRCVHVDNVSQICSNWDTQV